MLTLHSTWHRVTFGLVAAGLLTCVGLAAARHLATGSDGGAVGLMVVDRGARAAPDLNPEDVPASDTDGVPPSVAANGTDEPRAGGPDAATEVGTDPTPGFRPGLGGAGEAESVEVPVFDGRPLRKVRTIRMRVTAYSPDERSCGKWADGVTASGYSVWTNGMKLAAADTRILPFKTVITVPGYNDSRPIPVLDRGGKIKGHRLDVLYPTHARALQWGTQLLDVDVWEYAD